jgi:rhamnosyltransferase
VSQPRISIVLPTRNGMATLPTLLDAVAAQRVDAPVEVIAVDSSSSDGTAELLRARVDRVLTIAADDFDHGRSRNFGVEHATGDFIVLIVQDALPASDGWLAALVAPLAGDQTIAGSFARQQPAADASGITRHYAGRAFAASVTPRVMGMTDSAYRALHPMQRLDVCTFDNVCSCIRRTVWQSHPFKPTPIGEDLEWARDVLLAGHRLAYVPEAVVTHSHDRSSGYELARTYVLHHELYRLFGVRTIPSLSALVRAIVSSIPMHLRCVRLGPPERRGLTEIGRTLGLAFAWPLGQYLGALYGARGWRLRRWKSV